MRSLSVVPKNNIDGQKYEQSQKIGARILMPLLAVSFL